MKWIKISPSFIVNSAFVSEIYVRCEQNNGMTEYTVWAGYKNEPFNLASFETRQEAEEYIAKQFTNFNS